MDTRARTYIAQQLVARASVIFFSVCATVFIWLLSVIFGLLCVSQQSLYGIRHDVDCFKRVEYGYLTCKYIQYSSTIQVRGGKMVSFKDISETSAGFVALKCVSLKNDYITSHPIVD